MKPWTAIADVVPVRDRGRLPAEGKVKRSEVFELAADPSFSVSTVSAAAMAWGGMRVGFLIPLLESDGGTWLDLAQRIRNGELTRAKAYACLKKLRAQGKLRGMGPAFFTKLIYFLSPRDKPERRTAYIMDQWAASSVNLLNGWDVVLMDVTKTWSFSSGRLTTSFAFTVSDQNTAEDYEAFCSTVDQLAGRFSLGADQVDQALFSADETGPGCWRRYVIEHRPRLVGCTHRIRAC